MGCHSLGQYWNSAILTDINVVHFNKDWFRPVDNEVPQRPGDGGGGVRNHSSALLAPSPSVYCLIRAEELYTLVKKSVEFTVE